MGRDLNRQANRAHQQHQTPPGRPPSQQVHLPAGVLDRAAALGALHLPEPLQVRQGHTVVSEDPGAVRVRPAHLPGQVHVHEQGNSQVEAARAGRAEQ